MTKYFPGDNDVQRLAKGVMDCSTPKSEWTHAAHFAPVLWILRQRPDLSAEREMPLIIRAYNKATGVENTDSTGYHATITHASIRAARSFLSRHPASVPLHELIDLLMQTTLGDTKWVLAHWTRERLFSVEARRAWTEPDLRPLGLPGSKSYWCWSLPG